MGAKFTLRQRIEWGDTDPAKIVFYPQYFRWFDAACHQLFEAAGLSHAEGTDGSGAGFPIVEAHAEFKRPGYYADWIEVRAEITEVGSKVIKISYQAWRDEVLLLEGYEKRVCAEHRPDDPKRMSAKTIDAAMRAKLLGDDPGSGNPAK